MHSAHKCNQDCNGISYFKNNLNQQNFEIAILREHDRILREQDGILREQDSILREQDEK